MSRDWLGKQFLKITLQGSELSGIEGNHEAVKKLLQESNESKEAKI